MASLTLASPYCFVAHCGLTPASFLVPSSLSGSYQDVPLDPFPFQCILSPWADLPGLNHHLKVNGSPGLQRYLLLPEL